MPYSVTEGISLIFLVYSRELYFGLGFVGLPKSYPVYPPIKTTSAQTNVIQGLGGTTSSRIQYLQFFMDFAAISTPLA